MLQTAQESASLSLNRFPRCADGHAGGEVLSGFAEDDNPPAGHVFTAVVPCSFHYGPGAGIAHAEALARHSCDKGLAGGGAIESDIPDDDPDSELPF